ncbi:MAG: RNA 2',3'-cyclic phosphodiesterase [Pseudomonadota bacterium]
MSLPPPEGQRLFFALWPEAELQRILYEAGRSIVPPGGKPMAVHNLHITLAFLGTIDADKRLCMEKAADAIHLPPFELALDCAGFWPRPQVVWLGCREVPPPLQTLAARLNGAMAACGLTPENRPYSPHLTVQRKARQGPRQLDINTVHWAVGDFVLVQSLTLPEGAQYQVVRRWPLVGQM